MIARFAFAFLLGAPWAANAQEEKPAAPKQETKSEAPTAQSVIDDYVKAIGGKEAIVKRKSVSAKGTISVPAQGLNGTIEVAQAAPNKLFISIDLPGIGKTLNGFDGKVGWTISPITGASLMEGAQLEQLKEQAEFLGELHEEKIYKSKALVGKTKFEGKDCYEVKLVTASKKEVTEYFNVDSKLMEGRKSVESSPLGDLEVVTIVNDYKPFGDLKLPSKSTQKMGPVEMVTEMTSMEVDKVSEKAFELPAEIKALIKPD